MPRLEGSFGAQKDRRTTSATSAAATTYPNGLSESERARFAKLLVLVAGKRDRSAFAELFDFYAPRVMGYFLRLESDADLAEEITQDVMAAVWIRANEFDPVQWSASAWIFRLARTRRADACRIPLRPDVDPPDPMMLPALRAQPDQRTTSMEVEGRVRSAMPDLQQDEYDLLRLAFYEGKTQREIARLMMLPVAAVQRRIRAAFCRLQGCD